MTAFELMIRLRDNADLDGPLKDVVILEGAGGGPSSGGTCRGFVLVGGTLPGGAIDRIRRLANEYSEGEVIVVQRVRADA